jgi:hypothetical protein
MPPTTAPAPTLTREELISICEAAIVPYEKWHNRDSPHSQERVGVCWALLRAGCEFRILTHPAHQGDGCVTDADTIWLEITHATFMSIECGRDEEPWEDETFYLPTRKRLADRAGRDWY